MSRPPHEWNEADAAEAKRLWIAGLSSPEIARALGRRHSRQAISAKMVRECGPRSKAALAAVMRIGGARGGGSRNMGEIDFRSARGGPGSPGWSTVPRAPSAIVPSSIATPFARPMIERNDERECAYPVDGPGGEPWSCCAFGQARRRGAAVYCPEHDALMFGTRPEARRASAGPMTGWGATGNANCAQIDREFDAPPDVAEILQSGLGMDVAA